MKRNISNKTALGTPVQYWHLKCSLDKSNPLLWVWDRRNLVNSYYSDYLRCVWEWLKVFFRMYPPLKVQELCSHCSPWIKGNLRYLEGKFLNRSAKRCQRSFANVALSSRCSLSSKQSMFSLVFPLKISPQTPNHDVQRAQTPCMNLQTWSISRRIGSRGDENKRCSIMQNHILSTSLVTQNPFTRCGTNQCVIINFTPIASALR